MTLTPAERRGALALLGIFVLGAMRDLWETRPRRPIPPAPPAIASVVPGVADTGSRPAQPASGSLNEPVSPAAAPARRVDLNRASVTELDELPGVGPVLAGRIVEYRRLHGPFRAVEELMAVRGVGPKLFGRLGPRVSVGDTAPPAASR